MNLLVRIDGRVPWECRRDQDAWVAVCEPLKLVVQSDTWSEMMEDISDTLDAVLNDLMTTNESRAFLSSHGWHLATPLPSGKSKGDVRFDIPFIPVETHD